MFQAGWLLWLLAAGFLLRVLSGPRFSPFGLLQRAGMIPESVCEACVVGSR